MLFTGTGATAAIAKLVSALGLAGPLPAEAGPNDRLVHACYRVDINIVEFLLKYIAAVSKRRP